MSAGARYTIATIITKDESLKHRREALKKKMPLTDESIYKRGLEEWEKEIVRTG